jgi:hypothetical protein
MYREWIVPAFVAVVAVVVVIAVTQTVRFNCVDIGFYKSCGVSTVK